MLDAATKKKDGALFQRSRKVDRYGVSVLRITGAVLVRGNQIIRPIDSRGRAKRDKATLTALNGRRSFCLDHVPLPSAESPFVRYGCLDSPPGEKGIGEGLL